MATGKGLAILNKRSKLRMKGIKLAMIYFPNYDSQGKKLEAGSTQFEMANHFVVRYKNHLDYGIRQLNKWIKQAEGDTYTKSGKKRVLTQKQLTKRFLGKETYQNFNQGFLKSPKTIKELKSQIYKTIHPVGEKYEEEWYIDENGKRQMGWHTLMQKYNEAKRLNKNKGEEMYDKYGNLKEHGWKYWGEKLNQREEYWRNKESYQEEEEINWEDLL